MLEVLRHQQIEGSLATVVRYFGGVKLGAGGLVRAYTDAIAQALLGATLVPLVRQRSLRCAVPYALEGLVRRELVAVGAVLDAVQHDSDVQFAFMLPEPEADAFIARLDDAAQGRVVWPQA
jgi:putative IMPACT (imprinted ancient) family translation regulator